MDNDVFSTEHRYIELFLNSTASGAAEMSEFSYTFEIKFDHFFVLANILLHTNIYWGLQRTYDHDRDLGALNGVLNVPNKSLVVVPYLTVQLIHYSQEKLFSFSTLICLFKTLSGRGGGGYYGNSGGGGGGGSRSSGLRGAYWWCHPTLPIHPDVCFPSP